MLPLALNEGDTFGSPFSEKHRLHGDSPGSSFLVSLPVLV